MSAAGTPLVAVSIVNWNGAENTLRCLRSVRALHGGDLRVVVIDNASRDGSVARIRAAEPDVQLVCSPDNPGFAAGHALGLHQAQAWDAQAIWLLNNDAEADPHALQALLDAWQRHGDAIYGGLPLRRREDGEVLLNFPAKFLDPQQRPRAFGRDRDHPYDRNWHERAPMRVGAVVGSSLLLPLRLVQAHGWLDVSWFLHCEEIDYCYRLRRRGVPCYLVPRSRIWHQGGGSHQRQPRVEDCVHYYHARNEIVLAQRHATRLIAALIAARKLARGTLLAFVRPARAGMIWRGVLDALRGRMGRQYAPDDFLVGSSHDGDDRAGCHPLLAGVAGTIRYLRARIGRRWHRSACLVERVNGSIIAYATHPPLFLREYIRYCVDLLRERLTRSDVRLDLFVGECSASVPAGAPVRRVGFQFEHTLVKPGGRDSAQATPGRTPLPDGSGHYLVRIQDYRALCGLDLVIDYSQANLAHVRASGDYAAYLERTICVAPLIYPPRLRGAQRREGTVTLFADTRQTRRAAFLAAARAASLGVRNVRRTFDKRDLQSLYCRTRILVNVHQTAEHDTLEELRVLPALLCGVVIVSEEVPLRECIAYAPFIVWSSYANLVATVRAVQDDYTRQHARIFGDPALDALLKRMEADNATAVDAALCRLALDSPRHG